MTGIKGMTGSGGKREGAGAPKVADKKKVRSAYLRDKQNDWIVKKFGTITAALESLLPKKLK
jgi:hypothetical protein